MGLAANPTNSSNTVEATIQEPGVFLNSWGVDDELLESTATETSRGSFASSTGTQSSEAQETEPPDSGSRGLPTSAKVAIGVVIPLVVVAALILAFWLLRRKRRSSQGKPSAATTHGESERTAFHGKPELEGTFGRVLQSDDPNHPYEKPELSASQKNISKQNAALARREVNAGAPSLEISELPSDPAMSRRPVPQTQGKVPVSTSSRWERWLRTLVL